VPAAFEAESCSELSEEKQAQLWYECDIHYPQLIQLFRKPDPPAP
jgi:hypothetical protein